MIQQIWDSIFGSDFNLDTIMEIFNNIISFFKGFFEN